MAIYRRTKLGGYRAGDIHIPPEIGKQVVDRNGDPVLSEGGDPILRYENRHFAQMMREVAAGESSIIDYVAPTPVELEAEIVAGAEDDWLAARIRLYALKGATVEKYIAALIQEREDADSVLMDELRAVREEVKRAIPKPR